MEPDDVVGEDALVDLSANLRGQHAPRIRLAPGDVDEVMQERVRALAADHPRQRVEVVVVDHHDRLLDLRDLLERRRREVLVDDVVAEFERLGLVAADVRRVGQVPQVVLDEPQHRVGNDVVEAVVRGGVGGDQLDHVLTVALRGLDRERATTGLLGRLDVLVGHRRGDPGHGSVRGEAHQGGHEAARAALDLPAFLEGHRPPVGDQDEGRVVCHPRPTISGATNPTGSLAFGTFPLPRAQGAPP